RSGPIRSPQHSERAQLGLGTQPVRAGSLAMERHAPRKHKQIPRSLRRNALPAKRIKRSLLVRHEHLAGALVEQMEIGTTPSSSDGVLHHAPEAFDVIPTVSLDVISLVASSCGYYRSQIEPRPAQ